MKSGKQMQAGWTLNRSAQLSAVMAALAVFGAALFTASCGSKEESASGKTPSVSADTGANAERSQQVKTRTGLRYIDLIEGTGPSPRNGQTVTIHFVGTLMSGLKFDSSIDRNEPYSFVIGRGKVIKGWDEGVMSMKVGGKRRLIIPPDLAYGPRAAGDGIPPNSTLIFEVQLLSVQ
ncbi:MAG TPA: FKBP-type peptidyl-prolyl cis-trans isomerase [Blastocatellia bacterium]|nr:FKBP-type peptidyl-prolyl cis-trans isomerase [Blastocatellia bacterium]